MNHRQKAPPRLLRNPAYRLAFERLDEALAENTSVSNAEKIELIGRHMFGELWHDSEPSGSEVLPK